MSKKSRSFDETLADNLTTPEEMAIYLDEALENGTKADFLLAIQDIMKLVGVSKVAKEAGVGRESLYKTLKENGNPKLDTLESLLHALGLRLSVQTEDLGSEPS